MVSLGLNYGPASDPLEVLAERARAAISVYAQGDDYHEVIKTKLKALARWLGHLGGELKVFVDTAPLMEKPAAQAVGPRLAGQAHQPRQSRSSARGCSWARS